MIVISAFLMATVIAAPDTLPEPVEAPSIRPKIETEYVFTEARSILGERRPKAVKTITRLLARMRERGHGVDVPTDDPTSVPVGEITSLDEDGEEFEEDQQVEYEMKGTVSITMDTVDRYATETLILTRQARERRRTGGSGSASVATRVEERKIEVGGSSSFKAGTYERFYILAARCLKTGDAVVLDAARVEFTVVTQPEGD